MNEMIAIRRDGARIAIETWIDDTDYKGVVNTSYLGGRRSAAAVRGRDSAGAADQGRGTSMSDQTELHALIVRLEGATEGSTALDHEIYVVIGHDRSDPNWEDYTTSLDAALTLWDTPDIGHKYPRRGINLFYSVLPGGKMAWAAQAWELKDGNSTILRMAMADHWSRPMAACIVALKARLA